MSVPPRLEWLQRWLAADLMSRARRQARAIFESVEQHATGMDTTRSVEQGILLVIEDEQPIRRYLKAALHPYGFKIIEAATGEEGLSLAAASNPDVVLLDLGLPDVDGLEVTRRLREWSSVPIIVLSAREHEADKITALDAGADDYLTKPFGTGELMARIRVALRHNLRTKGDTAQASFTAGRVRVDFAKRQVFLDEEEVHLTPHEYKLLTILAQHAGKVVTHRQLLKEVWGQGYQNESHYLRVYMAHLRHKLEEDPARPRHFITEPGVGYRLKVE